jgi:NAD dependent epimerase/dehydratase family enzyme
MNGGRRFFFDAVINLAGEPIVDAAWSTRRKHVLRESRIGITEQLVVMMTRAQTQAGGVSQRLCHWYLWRRR